MRRTLTALLSATIFVACGTPKPVAAPPPAAASIPAPPATETKPVTEDLHGVSVTDPYRWLEDQQSPETRAWIERENAYTDQILGDLPSKQRFADRVKALLATDQMSIPFVRGGRYFFTKRPVGKDQFAIYMRESATGPDILLIDPAPMRPPRTSSTSTRGKTSAPSCRARATSASASRRTTAPSTSRATAIRAIASTAARSRVEPTRSCSATATAPRRSSARASPTTAVTR